MTAEAGAAIPTPRRSNSRLLGKLPVTSRPKDAREAQVQPQRWVHDKPPSTQSSSCRAGLRLSIATRRESGPGILVIDAPSADATLARDSVGLAQSLKASALFAMGLAAIVRVSDLSSRRGEARDGGGGRLALVAVTVGDAGRGVGMRSTRKLIAALVLTVFAFAAQGGSRKECRRACGSAVRSCMTETGQGLRACREEGLRRCAREGLQVCSSSLLPSGAGACSESAAPACAGSCPLAEFSCVPNPLGGCNCEAPACGRARASGCNGVCRHAGRVCVARGGGCKCA